MGHRVCVAGARTCTPLACACCRTPPSTSMQHAVLPVPGTPQTYSTPGESPPAGPESGGGIHRGARPLEAHRGADERSLQVRCESLARTNPRSRRCYLPSPVLR